MPNHVLSDDALDVLFRQARSHNGWTDAPVSDQQLADLYELMKWGPTSANSSPGRILFLKSAAAKERLRPCLAEGNVEKSMTAPVLAVIGMDLEFYQHLPTLFPHTDARSWYVGKADKILDAAFRNSTLQGAYFILAARALGLDCGPMSGFDAAKVNAEFFPDGRIQANFLCGLGHGNPGKLFARLPRLSFDQVCTVL